MASLGSTASAAMRRLEELIAEGVYPPLSRLPGERALAEATGISRTTLRVALHELAERGIIESSPWRGWFVAGNMLHERAELVSFTSLALRRGHSPGSIVLSVEVRSASQEESSALNVPLRHRVTELRRLRTLDDDPVCLDRSVVPTEHFAGLEQLDLSDASLYDVLEAQFDTRIVRSDYAVRASSAQSAEADALGIEAGAPVLVGDEVATDVAGTPLIMGHVVYRHDAYSFRATLFREARQRS